MATDLQGDVQVRVNLTLRDTDTDDLSTPQDAISYLVKKQFTNGAGVSQLQQVFTKQGTLSDPAGDVDLDLSGTAIQNGLGQDVALTELKVLYIENVTALTGTPATLQVSGNMLTAFGISGGEVHIPPNGFVLLVAPDAGGWTVTNTTQDTLTLTHDTSSGNDITYKVIVAGATS